MSNSVLYMSMSLDGFIAGPNDEPDNPGGDGFMRLHEWYGFEPMSPNTKGTGWGAHFMSEINATGAVLAGRRTVEQVDHWGGNHHGVPIFVPTHRSPGPSVAKYPLVTYVNDGIASAMAQAKAAAGDRDVMVHGAHTAQKALKAGVLDELQIHQIPVLFGQAVDYSKYYPRASNWGSSGRSTHQRPPISAIASSQTTLLANKSDRRFR